VDSFGSRGVEIAGWRHVVADHLWLLNIRPGPPILASYVAGTDCDSVEIWAAHTGVRAEREKHIPNRGT
jgi:hypothetical protein